MNNKYLFQYEAEARTPTFGVLLADHFQRGYGYHGHRAKGTNDWLMFYTKAGEGSFCVRDEVVLCKQGEIIILAPGIPHHYAANEGAKWDFYWVHFIPQPQWMPYLNLSQTEEKIIKVALIQEEMQQRLEHSFEKLIRDSHRNGSSYHELSMLSLTEMLILIYITDGQQRDDYYLDERIEQALQYISDHMEEKHSLSTLAHRAGLSPSRFRHLFKEQTGRRVSDWISTIRLQKAAKMLEITAKPINEIAEDTGFESPYYFTRRFSEKFGLSPSLYRKKQTNKVNS